MGHNTFNLIKILTNHSRAKMLIAMALLVVSGLLEGVSVIAILPVISLALESETQNLQGINDIFARGLDFFGIPAELLPLLSIIVGGIVLKALFLFIAQNMVSLTSVDYAAQKRKVLLEALMHCKWPYFIQKSAGEISSALTTESDRLTGLYMSVTMFYALIIQVVVYTGIAFLISWHILVGSLVVGAVLVLLLKNIVSKSREQGAQQVSAMKSLNSTLIDGLRILKPLKAMAREAQIKPYLMESIENLRSSSYKLGVLTNFIKLSQEPIMTVFLAVGVYVFLAFTSIDIATLLFTVLVYHRIVSRIGTVQTSLQKITSQQDVFWSVAKVIEETHQHAEQLVISDHALDFKKSISLQDVGFSYGDTVILSGLHAEIPARKFVSIVGPSGVGKTTLMEIIVGLNMPQLGAILVDGVVLDLSNLYAWRRTIGFVPQEVVLTNDTIMNNVTLYNDDISQAQVIEALKQAEAWDFVESLPEGIETMVGEQGARFSGGQRQRLCIARALAQKPHLIILDEPTTALDPETEAELCDTLKKISKTTTVIAISHQKKIAEVSDVVLYMSEDGLRTEL